MEENIAGKKYRGQEYLFIRSLPTLCNLKPFVINCHSKNTFHCNFLQLVLVGLFHWGNSSYKTLTNALLSLVTFKIPGDPA